MMLKRNQTMNNGTFFNEIGRNLKSDGSDSAAGNACLAGGQPIYYYEDTYPNYMVWEWPDGRRELVVLNANNEIRIVIPLEDEGCVLKRDKVN